MGQQLQAAATSVDTTTFLGSSAALGLFLILLAMMVYQPRRMRPAMVLALSAQMTFSPLALVLEGQQREAFFTRMGHAEAVPSEFAPTYQEPDFNMRRSPLEIGRTQHSIAATAKQIRLFVE